MRFYKCITFQINSFRRLGYWISIFSMTYWGFFGQIYGHAETECLFAVTFFYRPTLYSFPPLSPSHPMFTPRWHTGQAGLPDQCKTISTRFCIGEANWRGQVLHFRPGAVAVRFWLLNGAWLQRGRSGINSVAAASDSSLSPFLQTHYWHPTRRAGKVSYNNDFLTG